MRVVHESHCPEIGPICQVRPEPPHLHDQVLYITELRGIVEYGINEYFGVEAQFPVKITHTTIDYRRLSGEIFTPDYPNIHHRNETLSGAGDPWLSLRGTAGWEGFLLSARTGVSIPLGRTVRDPFLLGEMGQAHQHIQFGTGTFDPLFAVDLSRPLGPIDARLYGQAQLILYENGRGYQAGNRYAFGASAAAEIYGPLSSSLGLDVINEQPERWDGETHQDGNLGRTDVLFGGTIMLNIEDTELSIGLRTPVYQHIIQTTEEPGQLTYPILINLGATRQF